jgi:hypothetical protein
MKIRIIEAKSELDGEPMVYLKYNLYNLGLIHGVVTQTPTHVNIRDKNGDSVACFSRANAEVIDLNLS